MGIKILYFALFAVVAVAAVPHNKRAEPEAPTATSLLDDQTCDIGEQTWKIGEACTELDCQPCGFCFEKQFYYLRCVHGERDDPRVPAPGLIVRESCGAEDYWNPDNKPTNDTVGGGSCDAWDNLSEESKDRWTSDERCDIGVEVCKWGQDEECSADHWFKEVGEPKVPMSCPGGLLWDQGRQGCQPCDEVKNEAGDECGCKETKL